jgi:protein-tyrosine-phosphatase/DNA-binding transcriptional ArsR family regulator
MPGATSDTGSLRRPEPLDFLKLLAHEVRWELLLHLAQSDYRVQELVERVGRPMNLVSYHLAQLRQGHLVRERRSSKDGRDVYYSLAVDRLAELYAASGAAIHPFVNAQAAATAPAVTGDAPTRVLFLCTHNSARSQMAEALLRQFGGTRMEAFSAGTEPLPIHPATIGTLAEMGIDASAQQSKHLDTFAGQSFDYIITVCDTVRDLCLDFPGSPERIHWSFADPTAAGGSDADRLRAFAETARLLRLRINYLMLVLDQASLSISARKHG